MNESGIMPNVKILISAFCIISVVTLFCYFQAIGFGFLGWDSKKYIIQNQCVHGWNWENIRCIFSTMYFSNWHPITSLSYAAEYEFFGENASAYHLNNIILHIVNSCLIFVLAVKAYSFINVRGVGAFQGAFFAALLFAVHPQHVESVAWIAERKGLLGTMFFIIALLSYSQYVSAAGSSGKVKWFVTSIVAFICSLMSKPMAVTLPVLLLLLDVYPFKRLDMNLQWGAMLRAFFRLLLEKLPFFLATFVSILITILAQIDGGSVATLDNIGIGSRIINAVHSFTFYFSKWLIPLGLSPFYTHPEFVVEGDPIKIILYIAVFLSVLAIAFYLFLRGKMAFAIIISFVLVSLLPVIGIVQVGTQGAADRYTYLSLIPLYLAAGYCFYWLLSTSRRLVKISTLAGSCLIILLFSLVSKSQVRIWQSDLHLWSYVNSEWLLSGENTINVNTLQVMGLAEAYYDVGDYENALKYYLIVDSIGEFFNPNNYIHFARSYSFLGMDDMAMQIYTFLLNKNNMRDALVEVVNSDIEMIRVRQASKAEKDQ